MRLSPPEIFHKNDEVVVSVQVTFNQPQSNLPDRLWFSFPAKYAPFVTHRSDAFAAGLIILAMQMGEDLFVEGDLSPRLLRGLGEYQQAFNFWYPTLLSTIKIDARSLNALEPDQAGKETITLFSGGVDSAFTLMKHMPEHQPITDFQIRYALFIHGYDIPLQNRSSFDNACRTFSTALESTGVEIIPVRTNLRYFTTGRLPWMIAHGCATIAAGLTLDRLSSHLLVPATHYLDDYKPWGSSPLVDHWLSTETLETLHHGINASRMDKVLAIADWQPAQRFLRVCINEEGRDGAQNCSRCEKCFRTMIMLDLCQKLDQFQTFNRQIRPGDIVHWVPHYATGVVYTASMRQYIRKTGKTQYLLPIAIAHLRGLTMFAIRKMMPKKVFEFLKRRKFPPEKSPFSASQLTNASRE
jgi:hypothetical protein